MKMSIAFLSTIICHTCFSQEVRVGLEPMPPLINSDLTGNTIELLKKIEEVSDLKFQIKIKPYIRLRKEIEHGTLDLIGHTPYGKETKEFYQYAQDLNWSISSVSDIYAKSESKLKISRAIKIATPRGNAEFHSALLGIPISRFTDSGDLDSSIKMLKAGRIDLFIFERASTMKEIKKLKIEGLFYKKVMDIPSTLSVRRGPDGDELKKKIENAIGKINLNEIFKDYNGYNELPEKGVVEMD